MSIKEIKDNFSDFNNKENLINAFDFDNENIDFDFYKEKINVWNPISCPKSS